METFGRPVCDAFVERRNSEWDSCAFCYHYRSAHPFLDASTWHPCGPFVIEPRVVPNPAYTGAVA